MLGAFRGNLPLRDETRSLAALRGIRVDILVGALAGMTPPARAEDLHGRMPESRLVVLPGRDHMLTHEATDAERLRSQRTSSQLQVPLRRGA